MTHPVQDPLLPGPDKQWRPQFVTIISCVEVYPDENDVIVLGMRPALEAIRSELTGWDLMDAVWVRHR